MPFKVALSASRVNTALGCSWKYAQSYLNKIPSISYDGTKIGDTCHVVLECLAVKNREKLVSKILEERDIFSVPSIRRLCYKKARQHDIDNEDCVGKIKEFVLNGLSYDFYGESYGKPVSIFTEKDFLIEKEGRYKIRGFIDRLFIYEDGRALIRDYKSSKRPYISHECSSANIQGSIYALTVKELFPEVKVIDVEFLFLKFDLNKDVKWEKRISSKTGKPTKDWENVSGGGRILINYSHDEIDGIEYELEDYQQYLENFKEEDAEGNFAANQGHPTDGGFSGLLECGRSEYVGHLKKDGELMYACAYKHPMNYYWITKDGEFVQSCHIHEREKLLHKYPISDYHWEERFYSGCKRWQKRY